MIKTSTYPCIHTPVTEKRSFGIFILVGYQCPLGHNQPLLEKKGHFPRGHFLGRGHFRSSSRCTPSSGTEVNGTPVLREKRHELSSVLHDLDRDKCKYIFSKSATDTRYM
jgi:hypothetical protein